MAAPLLRRARLSESTLETMEDVPAAITLPPISLLLSCYFDVARSLALSFTFERVADEESSLSFLSVEGIFSSNTNLDAGVFFPDSR